MLISSGFVTKFTRNQIRIRGLINGLTPSTIATCAGDIRERKDVSKSLVGLLVSSYLRGSKSRELRNKLKFLNVFFKKQRTHFFVRNIRNKHLSFGVLYLYNLFYWATVARGATSVFRRRKRGVSNRFSNVYSSSEQNHLSMNREFVRLYRTIQKNELYKFSQPTTTLLLNSRKQLLNGLTSKPARVSDQKKLVASIIGSYLPRINKFNLVSTGRGGKGREVQVIKTSKVVYALNQYATNVFLTV
jgi:hypothetical protein